MSLHTETRTERPRPPVPRPYRAPGLSNKTVAQQASSKKGAPPPRPPPPKPALRETQSLEIHTTPKQLPTRSKTLPPRRPERPPPLPPPAPTMQMEKPSLIMDTVASLKDCSLTDIDERPTRTAPVSPIRVPPQSVNESSDSGFREAVCPFTADAVYEMSLEEGESVMEMEPADDLGWCFGVKDDGTQGYYPSSFVKPVKLF